MPNTVLLIKDQRACQRCRRCETLYSNTNKGSKGYICWRCRKWCLCLLHNSIYRVILLMSEVSKVDRELSIQSNVTHVEGVEKSSKWSYTSLLITFLIFNGFSICKKFWKAEI